MRKQLIFYFRFIVLILGIIASYWQLNINPNTYRYFTSQSNFFVEIWLICVLVIQLKEKPMGFLQGKVRGALVLYMTITALVNALVLGGWTPTYNNIIQHFLVPIAVFVDWIWTEKDVEYKWNYLGYWLIYPIIYLIVSIIWGSTSGFYPYFFMDASKIGPNMVIIWIVILIFVFIIVGAFLIKIKQIEYKKQKS